MIRKINANENNGGYNNEQKGTNDNNYYHGVTCSDHSV